VVELIGCVTRDAIASEGGDFQFESGTREDDDPGDGDAGGEGVGGDEFCVSACVGSAQVEVALLVCADGVAGLLDGGEWRRGRTVTEESGAGLGSDDTYRIDVVATLKFFDVNLGLPEESAGRRLIIVEVPQQLLQLSFVGLRGLLDAARRPVKHPTGQTDTKPDELRNT
jgi:hypothetical protein